MINLKIDSQKAMSLINRAKIFYGEDNIGDITVYVPDRIGEHDISQLDTTLYITNGGDYLMYELSFDENLTASIPITNDITDTIGERQVYAEFKIGDTVIGKTNPQTFSVYDFPSRNIEIAKRSDLFRRISELEDTVSDRTSDLTNVYEALVLKEADISSATPTSQYGGIIRDLPTTKSFIDYLNKALVTFNVPSGVTMIKDGCFTGQTNLQRVVINEGVTVICQNAFYGLSNLTEVVLPQSLRTIESNAFSYASALNRFVLPHGLTTIQNYACQNCTSLTTLTLPSTITSLGARSFSGCENLETVVFEHGITQVSEYLFLTCFGLKNVYLPNTLTFVNYKAFEQCYQIENVVLENGFNCSLDLYTRLASGVRPAPVFSKSVILNMFYALADRTGQSACTLTLGPNNLNQLTNEEKAIATSKNWNLA